MEALLGAFNQEKALEGASSVIVKTDESFAALMLIQSPVGYPGPAMQVRVTLVQVPLSWQLE